MSRPFCLGCVCSCLMSSGGGDSRCFGVPLMPQFPSGRSLRLLQSRVSADRDAERGIHPPEWPAEEAGVGSLLTFTLLLSLSLSHLFGNGSMAMTMHSLLLLR